MRARYDESTRAKAKRLWAEGVPTKQIAREINVTQMSVCSYVTRHREDFPPRHVQKNFMTPENYKTMRRMWSDGKSIKSIAHAVGYTPEYVGMYASTHRQDFPRRRTNVRMDAEKMAEVRRMYDEGMTMTGIAREFGCSQITVSKVLRKRA